MKISARRFNHGYHIILKVFANWWTSKSVQYHIFNIQLKYFMTEFLDVMNYYIISYQYQYHAIINIISLKYLMTEFLDVMGYYIIHYYYHLLNVIQEWRPHCYLLFSASYILYRGILIWVFRYLGFNQSFHQLESPQIPGLQIFICVRLISHKCFILTRLE